MRATNLLILTAAVAALVVSAALPQAAAVRPDPAGPVAPRLFAGAPFTPTAWVYLPLVTRPPSPPQIVRRVNVPYFSGDVNYAETAVFWLGRVTAAENYADVRVGYDDRELYVNVAVFDRLLWYDPAHSAADLTQWDSVTFLINTAGNTGGAPGATAYRFDAQLSDWQTLRAPWQAVYQGGGAGWLAATVPFTTESGYRWESATAGGVNNNQNNRGWAMAFHIPFAQLGAGQRPGPGTTWGMAVAVHDRDSSSSAPLADQVWPEAMRADKPSTWGQLHFGLPDYTGPSVTNRGATTISHKLNGAVVPDAAVGGTTGNLCPGDPTYIWNQWGADNFAGQADFNLQNQSDLADWPCFAKYYVTFPLSAIPSGKAIVSATLTLHQFGNSGAFGDPNPGNRPWPSLIQVFTVAEDWNESTLAWNNAPLALENVSRVWVEPVTGCGATVPWPCFARTWDVSYAVAQAYAAGKPLRLAMYEADSHYHSGKYFTTSDTPDWNATGRPTLTVTWGTSP